MGGYLHNLPQGSSLTEFGSDLSLTPPGYEDKYHEYAFAFNGLAPLQVVVGTPLVTENDADFIAYAWKMVSDVDFLFRHTDSEGRYMQKILTRALFLCAGTDLHPIAFSKPLYVPQGGVLLFDLTANQSVAVGAGNLQIVFIGVKRYRQS